MGYRLAACAGLGDGVPPHIFAGVYRTAVKGRAYGAGAQIYRELALDAAQRRWRRVETTARTDFTAESVARGAGALALCRRTTVI